MNSITLFDGYIQPTLVKQEHETTRKNINLCARATQIIFGIGCIVSTLKSVGQLGLMMTGGSFFFHGFLLSWHACVALGCYDMFRVADNVASIYTKDSTSRLSQAYLGNVSKFFTSLVNANNLRDAEKSFESHLGSIPGFTSALTDHTLVLKHFKPQINDVLNTRIN